MFMRRIFVWALIASLAAVAWNAISAQEVATLEVSDALDDYYARVWVVDDKPFSWIRAETPTRSWLDPVRKNPGVYLWRHGIRKPYRAVVWEDQASDAHDYVDALFREKYGYMDVLFSLLRTQPTVPIRLEPR
jgi:hypothetical protein